MSENTAGVLYHSVFLYTQCISSCLSTSVGFLHHHFFQMYISDVAVLDGSSCRLDLAHQSSSVVRPSPCLLLFQVPARYLLGT